MADDTTVKTSTASWKDECEKYDLEPEDKTAYEFANGRTFEEGDGPYANNG